MRYMLYRSGAVKPGILTATFSYKFIIVTYVGSLICVLVNTLKFVWFWTVSISKTVVINGTYGLITAKQ
jgi:hypothetical protein